MPGVHSGGTVVEVLLAAPVDDVLLDVLVVVVAAGDGVQSHRAQPATQVSPPGHSALVVHGCVTVSAQCGSVMIALQSGAQARLPPAGQVAPPKLGGGTPPMPPGSHCSSGPTRPSPQRSGPHWL